jgi:hypothetical protein
VRFAQVTTGLVPADVRQVQIEQDEAGPRASGDGERLAASRCLADSVAGTCKRLDDERPEGRIVVDDEDPSSVPPVHTRPCPQLSGIIFLFRADVYCLDVGSALFLPAAIPVGRKYGESRLCVPGGPS